MGRTKGRESNGPIYYQQSRTAACSRRKQDPAALASRHGRRRFSRGAVYRRHTRDRRVCLRLQVILTCNPAPTLVAAGKYLFSDANVFIGSPTTISTLRS